MSYPDITLLPPLARLLKVDLNTLLSFEDDLTGEEINHFCNEVFSVLKESGYKEGYELAMKKIREFPNSDSLIYNLAGFLKGTLLMFPVPDEDKAKYEEKIRELFERVAKNSETDWGIRGSALNMLVSVILQRRITAERRSCWRRCRSLGWIKGQCSHFCTENRGKLRRQ